MEGTKGMRRAHHWLLGLALAMAPPFAAGRGAERVATAIVFAVDVSGSVNQERYELQRAGIAGIFADDGVEHVLDGGLGVALMEWSDGYAVVVPWTILRTLADAHALARRINAALRSPGFSTELSLALLAAADLLDACPCEAAARIIDVSGDGENNGPVSTYLARDHIVARQIRINGLPIVTPAEPDLAQWYKANVIGGSGAFMEVANGYEDFERAMRRKFLLEVAALKTRPRLTGPRRTAGRSFPPADSPKPDGAGKWRRDRCRSHGSRARARRRRAPTPRPRS
jgi:hypothetical protein